MYTTANTTPMYHTNTSNIPMVPMGQIDVDMNNQSNNNHDHNISTLRSTHTPSMVMLYPQPNHNPNSVNMNMPMNYTDMSGYAMYPGYTSLSPIPYITEQQAATAAALAEYMNYTYAPMPYHTADYNMYHQHK